jgi:hypothetical protein
MDRDGLDRFAAQGRWLSKGWAEDILLDIEMIYILHSYAYVSMERSLDEECAGM